MTMDREESDSNAGHGEICDVVQRLTCEKLMRVFSGGTFFDWAKQKKYYVKLVMDNLSRELQPHEEQMIFYARSCFVCYKETDVKPCQTCFCVDFCEAHRTDNEGHPCEELKAWLYFEMQTIYINPVPDWLTFHDFPNKGDVNDMHSFYEMYVFPAKDASWTVLDTIYSDYLSWPLTVYYGLQDANLLNISLVQNTYVIHIVEARNMDRNNLLSWEIFLHSFEKSMKLVVIMIGLGLAPEFENNCGMLQTCWEKCMLLGHQFYFSCYRMLYHDYLDSELFTTPDVIIGFEVNKRFDSRDSWVRFITSLKNSVCPIILTTKTKTHAVRIINNIKNILSPDVQPIVGTLNRFKSLRPHRDRMTGRIFYLNEYIIIYMHLNGMRAINTCVQM